MLNPTVTNYIALVSYGALVWWPWPLTCWAQHGTAGYTCHGNIFAKFKLSATFSQDRCRRGTDGWI